MSAIISSPKKLLVRYYTVVLDFRKTARIRRPQGFGASLPALRLATSGGAAELLGRTADQGLSITHR